MIVLKNSAELKIMSESCKIAAQALKLGGEAVRPGVTTAEINKIIHDFIISQGATPSFLGYGGFPASACISINDCVIHGIPNKKTVIKEGDIVSIDVGAYKNGYHGDNASTFAAGEISEEAKMLLRITEESLYKGIEAIKSGSRLGDVGAAIQSHVCANGYGIVREYVGHGIGQNLHESPEVPNYGIEGRGIRLTPGMVIAIEPMINQGKGDVRVLKDDWTVVTIDGKLSAHFEHTVAITEQGPVILTRA